MKAKDSGIAKFRPEEQVAMNLWQGLILKTRTATDRKKHFPLNLLLICNLEELALAMAHGCLHACVFVCLCACDVT